MIFLSGRVFINRKCKILVKYDVIDQYLELHFCQTAQGLIFLTVFNKNISYSLIIIKLWLTYTVQDINCHYLFIGFL